MQQALLAGSSQVTLLLYTKTVEETCKEEKEFPGDWDYLGLTPCGQHFFAKPFR